ncbi:hypothetical protein HAP47_0000390 [Bradyrhizobium sp. 41S5]|uniref:hypothetical protein n=1 Tax=Bradyrhizobium sp. 41S5 TaxID=1404443 RepID=UPI00156A962F|nr:hypothetical protein [Bradyrhizobium sp. 41S5]UFX45235.1 hypothetical protein HAP47_0000390 [Bradyrhizobium sp. 41S5]
MTDADGREAQVNAFIEKCVQENWRERSQALLLSYLGMNLKNVFPESDKILGRSLRRYIETWPIVTMVVHPTQREKIGLIPLGVPVPSDVSSLFAEKKDSAPRVRADHTIYRQDFWNLFLTQLNARKFVVVTGDQNFLIAESLPQNPVEGTSYEVIPDDVVVTAPNTPTYERAKLARDKIDAWLLRNRLDKRIFEAHRTPLRHPDEFVGNPLDAFSSLDPVDQARISIPLDIVLKLLKGTTR